MQHRATPLASLATVLLKAVLLLVTDAGRCTLARPSGCSTDYDVCVIGAGGSGAFTAVKLKQKGLSVLVLEKQNHVGGHCRTWRDPSNPTNPMAYLETGVILYPDEPIVRETAAAFNVSMEVFNPLDHFTSWALLVRPEPGYGARFKPYTPDLGAFAALPTWLDLMSTRFGFLDTPNAAIPDFDKLPADTAQMLARPFWELYNKLKQEFPEVDAFLVAAGTVIPGDGNGPMDQVPALQALKNLRPSIIGMLVGKALMVQGGCSTLYEAFHQYLGKDVKLGVQSIALKRSSNYVQAVWKNANNVTVRKTCRRLVVSGTQSLDNMRSIVKDLDQRETSVFEQVTYNLYGTSIVRTLTSPLAPAGVTVNLVDMTLSDSPTTIGVSTRPDIYGGVGQAYTVDLNPQGSTRESTADLLYANLTQWSKEVGGRLQVPERKEDLIVWGPELHDYAPRPRDPSSLGAFYRDLYALQGHRNTYYTGALLSFNAQPDVWKYSDWLVNNTKWTCK